jgi:oligopeptide/dipeptide ABC transporter ATP-binding protein
MNEPVLSVEHLSVAFQTDRKHSVTAIRDVSFQLERGKILCIVGESGCGKSVTASSLMHLLPKGQGKVTGGSIRLDGRELIELTDRQMRSVRGREMAMIFQDPLTSLNPAYTVGKQMVEMLRVNLHLSKKEALEQAIEMLRRVGVSDPERRVREYPHQLSGGMIQRVMIAMALSVKPKILIADEPTTALDVTIQAQVLELMNDLRRETDTAILLITHDMGVVADMADDVMVMYAGEVVEHAPVQQLFRTPKHPYTQGLLRSLPRLDQDIEFLYTIEGTVPPASLELEGCRFADRCPECREICRREKSPVIREEQRQIRCHKYAQGGDWDA